VTSSYWQFAKFCLSPKEEIIHQFNPEDKKLFSNIKGTLYFFFFSKSENQKTIMGIS
jgi:hypothetical protein